MRPFSFTKNVGGFEQTHAAIRKGYKPGITVKQFKANSGLRDQSLVITEFVLGTQVDGGEEVILTDSLVKQTLGLPYSALIARLYFFAVNLNMPGARIRKDHQNFAEMQNTLLRENLYADGGFQASRFNKDRVIEPAVRGFGVLSSDEALRKWVTNYSFMAEQCQFVVTPEGRLETFPDNWGVLALRLFFERYEASNPVPDASVLVYAAVAKELHKLIGVPRNWLDERIFGAAEMYVSDQDYAFVGFDESKAERRAAKKGAPQPPPGKEAQRRELLSRQIIRRGDNRRYLEEIYGGQCQISGVKLMMPNGSVSFDCAHIKPLGGKHGGKDDVGNMLSLSPTMHRLFDRGCVQIDPETLTITMLHGNEVPHLPRLLLRGNHQIQKGNLSYHLSEIINRPRFP
jgi:hypothetical protein